MKTFRIIVLLLLPLTLFADADVFTRTFGGAENDFAYAIGQTADGGYIVAGQTDSFGNGSDFRPDIWILKLDGRGEKQWERTFGDPDKKDGAFAVQQTADLGYIVAGATESFGAEYASIWIVKLDADGDSLWSRLYKGAIVSSASSIRQTFDGGFIISGKGKENLIKLDAEGNRVWGTHFSWVLHSVWQTADSGYIAAGDSIYRQLEWNYIPSVSMIKVDRNGIREWSNPLGDDFTGRVHAIRQTADRGYILAGDSIALKSELDYSTYLMVMKLDAGGRRLWSYRGNEYSSVRDVQPTADGGYVAIGDALDPDHAPDLLIVKLDEGGHAQWTKTYGVIGGWEYASSGGQTVDGGFIVAGQTNASGECGYDMWILKLDENGNAGPVGIPDPPDAGIDGFTLSQNYPNPFSQSTTIRFNLPKSCSATLTIHDIGGRTVETVISGQHPAGATAVEWNTRQLPDGVYFCRLQAGPFMQTKRLLVLR
jgi:hypothetical protein